MGTEVLQGAPLYSPFAGKPRARAGITTRVKSFLSRISYFAAPQLYRVALVAGKEKGEDFIPSKEKNGGPRKQNCSASSLLHPHSNSQQANDFPVLSESQEQ